MLGGRLPGAINQDDAWRIGQLDLIGPSRGLPVAPVKALFLGPQPAVLGAARMPGFAGFFSSVGGNQNHYLNGRRSNSTAHVD